MAEYQCLSLDADEEEEVGNPIYVWNLRVNLDKLWEINQIKETFKAQYFIHAWLSYKGDRKKVKKDMKNLEERLWIENSVEIYDRDRDKPKVEVKESRVELTWLIKGEFAESMELHHFPFDTQELKITIKVGVPNRKDKPLHKFRECGKSQIILNVFPLLNTWTRPKHMQLEYFLSSPKRNFMEDRFPLLTAVATVTRYPSYHLWNICFPMGSIVVMSWSSFSLAPEKKSDRIGISLTLVLTAVAYKYIVAQMVPHISYNTILDKYILTCWLFLFLMVLENCFVERLCNYEFYIGLTFAFLFLCFNLGFWCFGLYVYRLRLPPPQNDLSESEDSEEFCGLD